MSPFISPLEKVSIILLLLLAIIAIVIGIFSVIDETIAETICEEQGWDNYEVVDYGKPFVANDVTVECWNYADSEVIRQ